MSLCDVSIIIPTRGRLSHLQVVIANLRRDVEVSKEIIVIFSQDVDDGTEEWLSYQSDISSYPDGGGQLGAIKPYNIGFRQATGRYVTWWSDDLYVFPGVFKKAIDVLTKNEGAAGVVFAHNYTKGEPWGSFEEEYHFHFVPYRGREQIYLNFGLLRTDLFRELGFFDERYCNYFPDTDISIAIYERRMELLPLKDCEVIHFDFGDATRTNQMSRMQEDHRKFLEKWGSIVR